MSEIPIEINFTSGLIAGGFEYLLNVVFSRLGRPVSAKVFIATNRFSPKNSAWMPVFCSGNVFGLIGLRDGYSSEAPASAKVYYGRKS